MVSVSREVSQSLNGLNLTSQPIQNLNDFENQYFFKYVLFWKTDFRIV